MQQTEIRRLDMTESSWVFFSGLLDRSFAIWLTWSAPSEGLLTSSRSDNLMPIGVPRVFQTSKEQQLKCGCVLPGLDELCPV
jgi:hypothetical protein